MAVLELRMRIPPDQRARVLLALLCVSALGLTLSAIAHADESDIDTLIERGVTLTFEGRRDDADEVWQRLRKVDPTSPAGALHQVDTLWWRVMFDEGDTKYDDDIESYSIEATRLARQQLQANPEDADAHYYLGRALIHRGRLDGIRGRFLAAGSFGEEGRPHLERAVEIDPNLIGARYPLGLYYFYADLVTRWFKWLSWLWFVPSGDGPTGLRYIEGAADRPGIHQYDAQFVLADISMDFPPLRVDRAEALLDGLHERFPANTLIHYQLIDARFTAGRFQDVIDESFVLETGAGGDELDDVIRSMAPLWRARAELQMGDAKRAAKTLRAFPEHGPARPHWGNAWVSVTRAQLLDSVGKRPEAEALYQRVTDLEAPHRSREAAVVAEGGLDAPFTPGDPTSYLEAASDRLGR